MDESASTPRGLAFRSGVVAVASTLPVAGCSALWDQTGATDVVVHSAATDPVVVSDHLERRRRGAHTSRTLDLAPGRRSAR
jgi:hypothetical protein